MNTFIQTGVVGGSLLVAMIGWGCLVEALLGPARAHWSLRAAWGMAVLVNIGALLNAFAIISPTLLTGVVALGIVLTCLRAIVVSRSVEPATTQPVERVTLMESGLRVVLLLHCLSLVVPGGLNQYDDKQAYCAFPLKMIQTGHMGPEPFSERRLVSGLGGMSFLQAVVLSNLPMSRVSLVDPALSIIILYGMVEFSLRTAKAPLYFRGMILFGLAILQPPGINITALVSASMLFFALYLTLDASSVTPDERHASLSRDAAVATIVAAICALKTNLVPVAISAVVIWHLLSLNGTRGWQLAVRRAVKTHTVILVLLLPWMAAMHRDCGTFLFPLLGRGFHMSAYASLPSRPQALPRQLETLAIVTIACLTAGGAAFCVRPGSLLKRPAAMSIMGGAMIGMISLALYIGRYGLIRYSYPALLAAILIVLIEHARAYPLARPTWPRVAVLLVLVAGFALGLKKPHQLQRVRMLYQGLTQPQAGIEAEFQQQYLRIQQSVPEHSRLLTRLDAPFLLDFRRNTIYIVDLPGCASPPPGMPYHSGGEALATYLRNQDIHFVAYSYKSQCGVSADRPWVAETLTPYAHPWLREQTERALDFQSCLSDLANRYRVVFDDGDVFVLDLNTPQSTASH